MNTLDYSQFNLYVGLPKSAFREAFNILDKCAVFLIYYYALVLREHIIFFSCFWQRTERIREEIES